MKDKMKKAFQSRKFIGGAYATVISIVVIAIILLVNFIFTELDIQLDTSSQQLYTISDKSKELVEDIEDEITIYYLVELGNEDAQIVEVINRFKQTNDNVSVEYKDPILYPQFANQYVEHGITQNSIIVVNETQGRSKYVDYMDMYVFEIDNATQGYNVTAVDVEGQVISAINYVTTEDLPIIYSVVGHGEEGFSDTLRTSLDKVNITINTLDTLSSESIPDDCSVLLINAPETDYNQDESRMIREYLQNGGNAIIFVDYKTKELTNVSSLLEYYGSTMVDGYILEENPNYYVDEYRNQILANVSSHEITSNVIDSGKWVIAPVSTGLEASKTARNTLVIDTLLETNDTSYSRIDINSTNPNKLEDDIDGPFTIGTATKETHSGVETNVIVFGTPFLVNDNLIGNESIGNLDLLIDSVNYVTGREESITIMPKSLGMERLFIKSSQVYLWGAITVFVMPLLILSIGGVIVIRRRKK